MSDRQAADAVRARINWKYALGLELDDPDFDFSVLSAFRARLVESGKAQLPLDRMLEHFRTAGLLKVRGKQRTDSTGVLGNIGMMNRLEIVGETLRAALNQIATVAPGWLRQVVSEDWYGRYAHRVEELRLPKSQTARAAYGLSVDEDGFVLLDAIRTN